MDGPHVDEIEFRIASRTRRRILVQIPVQIPKCPPFWQEQRTLAYLVSRFDTP